MLRILCLFLYLFFGKAGRSNATGRNLTKITWAHAVDSDDFLSEVLNGDINFIEADILMGYLTSDTENRHELPIMAHPPATTSDLSLENFLKRILIFNNHSNLDKVKGVKLDFKSIEAFESSVEIIKKNYNMQQFPTWINADILPGPVNNMATIPVDPLRFFSSAKRLGPAVLSIGWTTKWGTDANEGQYSATNIQDMISTIKANGVDTVGHTLTFPIRAGIAANSLKQLIDLYCSLKDSNEVTFTIWSSANDAVNIEQLRELIFTFGLDKVYVDVPDELKNQLHLENNPFKNTCRKAIDVRCYEK